MLLKLPDSERTLTERTNLGFLFALLVMLSVEESFSQETAKLALLFCVHFLLVILKL